MLSKERHQTATGPNLDSSKHYALRPNLPYRAVAKGFEKGTMANGPPRGIHGAVCVIAARTSRARDALSVAKAGAGCLRAAMRVEDSIFAVVAQQSPRW